MTPSVTTEQLQKSAQFRRLVRTRVRVCFTLTAVMVGYFSAFYVCMAWFPVFMASRPISGSVISTGLLFSISSMLLALLLSGIYVWWSDNRYDPEKARLLRELQDAGP